MNNKRRVDWRENVKREEWIDRDEKSISILIVLNISLCLMFVFVCVTFIICIWSVFESKTRYTNIVHLSIRPCSSQHCTHTQTQNKFFGYQTDSTLWYYWKQPHFRLNSKHATTQTPCPKGRKCFLVSLYLSLCRCVCYIERTKIQIRRKREGEIERERQRAIEVQRGHLLFMKHLK